MIFIGFGKKPEKPRIKFTVQKAKQLGRGGVPRRKLTLLFQQYGINVRKHRAAAQQIENLFKQMETANASQMKSLNQQFANAFQRVLDYERK